MEPTLPAVEGPVERPVRRLDDGLPVDAVRFAGDAEGAFPVFRRPHDGECTNDLYARSVCEGMWADKCDDVTALVDALRVVYSLAGENRDVKRIVHEAIAKHGGPEVA